MFGVIDLASIATIIGSFAFIMYSIKVELKIKV
jgi:hypothetical protein